MFYFQVSNIAASPLPHKWRTEHYLKKKKHCPALPCRQPDHRPRTHSWKRKTTPLPVLASRSHSRHSGPLVSVPIVWIRQCPEHHTTASQHPRSLSPPLLPVRRTGWRSKSCSPLHAVAVGRHSSWHPSRWHWPSGHGTKARCGCIARLHGWHHAHTHCCWACRQHQLRLTCKPMRMLATMDKTQCLWSTPAMSMVINVSDQHLWSTLSMSINIYGQHCQCLWSSMSLINIYDQHCQCLWSSMSLINSYDQHCQCLWSSMFLINIYDQNCQLSEVSHTVYNT